MHNGNFNVSKIIYITMFTMLAFIVITMFIRLYVRVGNFSHVESTCITRRVEIWVHFTRLTPPPFIEAPVQSKENARLCICVVGVSTLPLSMIIIFDFGALLSTVWYFLFFILLRTRNIPTLRCFIDSL